MNENPELSLPVESQPDVTSQATPEPVLQETVPAGATTDPGHSLPPASAPGIDMAAYEAAMRQAAEAKAEIERMREVASFGQAMLPHATAFNDYLESRKPKAPETPQAPPAWNPPKPDENLLRHYYRVDESGNYGPIQGTPPEFVAKVNAYREYIADHRKGLESNPVEHLSKFGFARTADIEKMVNDRLQAEFEQREYAARTRQIADELRSITRDANGNITPYGKTYIAAIQQFEQLGIRDPERLKELAQNQTDAVMWRQHQKASQADSAARARAGLPPQVSAPTVRSSPIQDPNVKAPAGSTFSDLLKASNFSWAEAEKDIYKQGSAS